MAYNRPITFYDQEVITPREAEVPNADFRKGMNHALGILGPATAVKNFKDMDFTRPDPPELHNAQYIAGGWDTSAAYGDESSVRDQVLSSPGAAADLIASAEVQPNGLIDTVSGMQMYNRTGEVLNVGDRAFGSSVANVLSDPGEQGESGEGCDDDDEPEPEKKPTRKARKK